MKIQQHNPLTTTTKANMYINTFLSIKEYAKQHNTYIDRNIISNIVTSVMCSKLTNTLDNPSDTLLLKCKYHNTSLCINTNNNLTCDF